MSKREMKIWQVTSSVIGVALGLLLLAWGVLGIALQTQVQGLESKIVSIAPAYTNAQNLKSQVEACVATDLIVLDAYDSYFAAYQSWVEDMSTMFDYGIFAGDYMVVAFTPQLAAEGDDFLAQAKQAGCGN